MLTLDRGVLILYNQPPQHNTQSAYTESVAGVLEEVRAVAESLRVLKIHYREAAVSTLADVQGVLSGASESVVFNLVEGLVGDEANSCLVHSLCIAAGKACTGNSTAALLLTLDKWRTKAVLEAAGLPTPQSIQIGPGEKLPTRLFPGPYIVKPVRTDASEEIDAHSIIARRGGDLENAVANIHRRLRQPSLIEQYIDGRELNVSVICQKGELKVLPLAEIDFSAFGPKQHRIVGYAAKWRRDSFEFNNTPRIIPASLPKKVTAKIEQFALAACRAVDCAAYCRVDFRLDQKLNPYILEINANPDISPDAGFPAALAAAKISYARFVKTELQNALTRFNAVHHKSPAKTTRAKAKAPKSPDEKIRHTQPADRDTIVSILVRTKFFRPDELAIAAEVLDDALRQGPAGHYQSYVLETAGRVAGWICFGLTPCTVGTYDIYWIAVDPNRQGGGVGKKLMAFAEHDIVHRGGRLAVVETSGRDSYLPTQRFYERIGYTLAARLKDFYAPDDDKTVYLKTLSKKSP
jgi:D-alanine-D-alanine ligase